MKAQIRALPRWLIFGALFLLLLTFVAPLGYRSRLDHLSCAECRSLRYVSTSSYCGIPLESADRIELAPSVPPDHVHRWWRYSLHQTRGFTTGLACKPYRYEDHTSN